MKTNLINGIIGCLLLAGVTNCKNAVTNNNSVEDAGINIPAVPGMMAEKQYNYDDYGKIKRITAAERKSFRIDEITLDDISKQSNKKIAAGKSIWQGEEGQLATFMVIVEDHSATEYLASYDSTGNFKDCMLIGVHMLYTGDYESSVIEGNTVKCTYSWMEPGSEWGGGCAVYTITDDLHFKPFAWPPASFPVQVPFASTESDEAPLHWTIESVTCTGVSGKAYTFTVKGKGKTDSKAVAEKERNVSVNPVDAEFASLGDPVVVAFPAVGEGQAYEAKVKVLFTNGLEEKTFSKLQIRKE